MIGAPARASTSRRTPTRRAARSGCGWSDSQLAGPVRGRLVHACTPARWWASPGWSAPAARRSRRRIFGLDPRRTRRRRRARHARADPRSRATRCARASASSPRIASGRGWCWACAPARTRRCPPARFARAGWIDRQRRARRRARRASRACSLRAAGREALGLVALGRQPAEGGARQVADGRQRPAHPRRAHARRRRGREGRAPRAGSISARRRGAAILLISSELPELLTLSHAHPRAARRAAARRAAARGGHAGSPAAVDGRAWA